MKVNQFEQSILIQTPIETAFAFLVDFQNLKQLQPFVTRVNTTPTNKKNVVRLEVTERIVMFGFLPVNTTVPSIVHILPEESRIRFETKAFPKIHIQNEFSLQNDVGQTRVVEKATFICPSYVERFAFKQFTFAHHKMFAQLKMQLEER
ncbi:SRPBCC family protein [Paenibacillus albus]|nr:SRPBCC family protein [Paenibacillus albus]